MAIHICTISGTDAAVLLQYSGEFSLRIIENSHSPNYTDVIWRIDCFPSDNGGQNRNDETRNGDTCGAKRTVTKSAVTTSEAWQSTTKAHREVDCFKSDKGGQNRNDETRTASTYRRQLRAKRGNPLREVYVRKA